MASFDYELVVATEQKRYQCNERKDDEYLVDYLLSELVEFLVNLTISHFQCQVVQQKIRFFSVKHPFI